MNIKTIKKHIPFLTLFFIGLYFLAINYQFFLFSYFSFEALFFVRLSCIGIIFIAAFSIFFSTNKILIKIELFFLIFSIVFIFKPIKYTANDLPIYLKRNVESFNKITQIIDEDSILTISYCHILMAYTKKYHGSYESVRKINYNTLEKEIRKLNISEIHIQEDKYIFCFDDYAIFGLIKTKNPEFGPSTEIDEIIYNRIEKIYGRWYYFTIY
jgi:hypothetical protein